MDPRSQPVLDQSLIDTEYDRLEAILRDNPTEDAMDIEEMDGFFAALIGGPVTVPPSVYLEEVWGGEEAPFATVACLEEFLNLTTRHWNFITRELASPDLIHLPWLKTEEGEEIPRGNRWAQGFLRGISLCRDEWNEIFEVDDRFAMLLPVLALVHENDPDVEMRPWKTSPDTELRTQVLAGLAAAAQKLYDYFLPRRIHGARVEQNADRAARRKIGRNDPCYCGSGKKYKRCCGNVTIH